MKHYKKHIHIAPLLQRLVVSVVFGALLAFPAFAVSPLKEVRGTRGSAQRGVPVMMLALPGRGVVLSAPGDVVTVVIESSFGNYCGAYLARTDEGGVLEVPVAASAHCPAPRIVVHR